MSKITVTSAIREDDFVFDAPACEVQQDGTLLIYADTEGMCVLAGFATGVWAAFLIEEGETYGNTRD